MKISDVQAHVLAIPMAPGKQKMPWTWGNFNQVIISVHTDEGLTGYGEAFGYGVPQATASVVGEILKPMLVGADATQITALQDRMFRHTHLFGRYGVTNFTISGVDIALWDLAGKSAGLPLYRLFGGATESEVPAYASLVRYAASEHVSEAVAQARDEGYDAIKLHQIDVESVHVAREAAGDDILLMLDVNCSWAPDEALDIALQCIPYNLYWLEEPIWPPEDFEALAHLGQASETPIATGENACTVYQFQHMIETGCASFVQPSVTKVGGISEWRKVAALAEARNIQVAAHSPISAPAFWPLRISWRPPPTPPGWRYSTPRRKPASSPRSRRWWTACLPSRKAPAWDWKLIWTCCHGTAWREEELGKDRPFTAGTPNGPGQLTR